MSGQSTVNIRPFVPSDLAKVHELFANGCWSLPV